MSDQAIPTRDRIDSKYLWNAESVFPTPQDLEAEFQDLPRLAKEVAAYQGKLSQGPGVLVEAFEKLEELTRRAFRLRMYTNMAYSVNTLDQEAAKANSRAQGLLGQAMAAAAYIHPELLEIGREALETWLDQEPRLAFLEHYIDNLFRMQAHVRSAEVEELLGMLNDPFIGPYYTYQNLVNADLKFKPARASDGKELPFTSSTLQSILTHSDREARRTAWENYTGAFLDHKNTFAGNLSTYVKQTGFKMRARRFRSSLEASLFENNIPVEVFHNLIETFRENLPTWRRYWAIRRKALGVATLHPYDAWAPLSQDKPFVPYEQAVDWIAGGLQPMGEEYVGTIRRACLEERWVDVYPNQGKTAGAFSTNAPGTYSLIKMSYDDSLNSLSTLAHELGHSMHSHLSWRHQPVILGRYTLFLAEVASNFHQAMVRAYLLENKPDPNFQLNVIEEAMYNFHRYFFQMPTLARFELEIHERVERGQGLSADDMNELMADLFDEAYGGEMHVDRPRVGITWATFQHMYLNFYVYQYATGIAGAHALANRILSGEPGAVDDYLGFLKSGGSRYSLDILKSAGVDLTTPAPVEAAFQVLAGYVDRLETLCNIKGKHP